MSGAPLKALATQTIADMYRLTKYGKVPIIGVGGVSSGATAGALMRAGAAAVQVGTASFADPRAPKMVADDLEKWAREQGFSRLSDITGARRRLAS